MTSLKKKTVHGLTWSFIDNLSQHGITFVVGIVLARLLTPREFGLIGMTTIFIAISQSFINSGFTQALIRKKNCTQNDYSTVFFFNIIIAVFFYLVLFFSAETISNFFNEPDLKSIIKILGIGLIINSFSVVQLARLTKRIDFKLQTKISVIASVGSGIIGIIMAYNGYGVWSLVVRILLFNSFNSIFLWLWNNWRPSAIFSWQSFHEMFAFGSRLLLSGLIDTAYRNIYLLIIGKFFSAIDLGFYTRANQFKRLPSQNITGVVQRVSYPVLSTIQDDIPRLRSSYQKLIRSTMLITFISMMGLAAVSESLVLTLIGEQWLPSVIYLQLLCFAGMLYPLHAINLNMLNVQGRSDLYLRLEIIKKILAVPVIIIGVYFGIEIMILGMMANSLIAYFLNSYYSGRNIGYSSFQQIKDILPSFLLAVFIGGIVFLVGELLNTSYQVTLIIQIFIGLLMTISLSELLKLESYIFIKKIIFDKLKNNE